MARVPDPITERTNMPDVTLLLEGGCTCGSVRYRLETAPLFVNCCHCSWCQRETGSAFVINALIEAARMTLQKGAPAMVPTPSASGKGQKIWRCENCRVALWSNYFGAGEKVNFVRVGTLDHPAALAPGAHIFTETKLPWVHIPENVPSFVGFYNPAETWPEEARVRMRVLRPGYEEA
ncbi:GFA family protein [Nisaea acidiphila]|uniref:GFA family protein n=1 Tax=Nisaea acidiphila TaxID=1862145 RepID=A0A9J7AVM1_9PROT|nr:GFA family protein [Nisaea acidiphila]UUX50850.1 GFA family protein [Nisaea acidiphila]